MPFPSDHFLLCGTAEFSLEDRSVVVAFNVQTALDALHVVGDFSRDTGHILEEIADSSLGLLPGWEDKLAEAARGFGFRCRNVAPRIISELRDGG